MIIPFVNIYVMNFSVSCFHITNFSGDLKGFESFMTLLKMIIKQTTGNGNIMVVISILPGGDHVTISE